MTMLNLNRPVPERDPKFPENTASTRSSETAAVFEVKKKRITVDKKHIKAVSKKMATLAMEMGLTASPEEFASMFEEDFTEALKQVEKRRKK